MILKALTLENFKGIREPVRVEFAPLTLLFGPNNAGKSTIVQALMYAREVLERNNCDAGRTELGGDVVDLGGFENIVHGRDLNRVIKMRFELDLTEKSLPIYSGWIEQNELEKHIWDLGRGEEGFDVTATEKLISRLNHMWVEMEISWDSERGAHVSGYSVGHGVSPYARISLAEKKENGRSRALLSSFSYGTYPFGSTYEGRSELGSSLVSQARRFIKDFLLSNGLGDFQEGARVAMDGEAVDPDDNRVPWDRFNELVDNAVAGRGVWGDSAVDAENREKNFFYEMRQHWLKMQELALKSETPEEIEQRGSRQERSDEPSPAVELNASDTAPSATLEDQGGPAAVDLEGNRGPEDETCEDEEIESWFWDLLQILVKWEFIPSGRIHPLRLNLLETALPEWGRKLDFDPRIWEESEDPAGSDWQYYLVMGREYLTNLLTAIVVGPGERLKEALEQSMYLSPFREMPQRNFAAVRSLDSRRWCNGLAAWDQLIVEGEPLALRVNEWLNGDKGLNSGYRIEVKRFKELDVDSELLQSLVSDAAAGDLKPLREQISRLPEGRRLRIVSSNGASFSPQDLGVGISQVIPVIVTALHNSSGVVAIEEPESNIHPAFQVVLGDLFLSQANASRETMFLVETHSEHLVLRIMRRMRETYHGEQQGELAVRPSDISILFVEREADRTLVRPMPLNEVGELVKAWPGGFFEEGLREQFGDD